MATQKERLDQLKAHLNHLANDGGDPESDHTTADQLLLDFINDKEVTEAYDKIKKWYA